MPTASVQELERIAQNYAKRGWHVFPVHSIGQDGLCTCSKKQNCDRPGKHPPWNAQDLPHGLISASTDPGLIQRWWNRWPGSNIAGRTGVGFGLVIVDADLAKGGVDTWQELQDIHGPVETLTTLTGDGGNHFIFQDPGIELKGDANVLGPGLDTRGQGVISFCRHPGTSAAIVTSGTPKSRRPKCLSGYWICGPALKPTRMVTVPAVKRAG